MCLFSLSVVEKVRKVINRKETDFNAAIKSERQKDVRVKIPTSRRAGR